MKYSDWKQHTEHRLKALFGIDLADIGFEEAQLIGHHRTWPEPTEFIQWFANKYDLDRLP